MDFLKATWALGFHSNPNLHFERSYQRIWGLKGHVNVETQDSYFGSESKLQYSKANQET